MENIGKYIKTRARRLRQGNASPDFFEFVRRIERACPDLPRLGYAKRPTKECVRFGQTPYLHFPTTEISEIIEGNGRSEAFVLTYFFGLLGVNGPMPLEFTNYVFQRSHNYYDQTWRRFLDIIHHRFLTLFFRAFQQNEQAVSFDRPDDDPITDIIRSLSGSFPDQRKDNRLRYVSSRYANMFGCAVKNRMALEEILKNILKMDLHVSEFVVSSYDIPQECWCQLGNEENAVLGKNIQLGRTYMSATREFKISLGPVDFKECQALLPGSKGFELLTEIINLYMDRPLEYTLLFKICSKSIPQASFGDKKSVQLGRCCWVGKANKNADVIQLSIGAARLNRKHHRGTFFNVE